MPNTNISHFTLILIFWIIILNYSCNYSKKNSNDNFSSKTCLSFNLTNAPTSLDPAMASTQANAWITQQIFDGLLEIDSNNVPKGCIAKSWKIENRGTLYRFFLADNIYFQPPINRKVTAQDFKYSFTRLCSPKTASTGQWIFNDRIVGLDNFISGKKIDIEGFKVINDTIFEIHLNKPYIPFLSLLATPFCSVVPKELVEKDPKQFAISPVGTGAFIFYNWKPGRQIVLHKNPNYFQKNLPKLDAIRATFIANKLTAFLELKNGNIDLIEGIDPILRDEILTSNQTLKPELAKKISIDLMPQLTVEYFGFNLRAEKASPLKNKYLRKALSRLINRQKCVENLLGPFGETASNFTPRGISTKLDRYFSRNNNVSPNNDSIKIWINMAGYKSAEDVPLLTLSTTISAQFIADYISKEWKNAGFKIQTETLEGGTLRQMANEGKLDIWRATWVADYSDPENFMSLFYSPNHSPIGPNSTHYYSPKFDSFFKLQMYETNDSIRENLFIQLENIIIEESPVLPIYYYKSVRLYNNKIKNVPRSSSSIWIPMKYIRKENS